MGKLLFIFVSGVGHFNVCEKIAKLLIYQYPEHEIYFNIFEDEPNFYDKVLDSCDLFKPILMDKLDGKNPRKDENFQKEFVKNFFRTGISRYKHSLDPIEKIQDLFIMSQKNIEKVIEKVQPDFILSDSLFSIPYIENKGIPFGYICSMNPLYAQDSKIIPPPLSGLSVDAKKDGHLWSEYRTLRNKSGIFEKRKKWYENCGIKLDDQDNEWILKGSQYLNIMIYPEYCKYFEPDSLDGKWFTTSIAILPKYVENEFQIKDENNKIICNKYPGKELLTPEFLAKPGKLILFSLGTIVTIHVEIFKQLLSIIEKIPHKFIVSYGPNFKKEHLPSNCVGAPFLDQKALYGIVDTVISHGGNNTFSELFYYHGKPFIIIPFFADQYDNQRRLIDLQIGISLSLNNLGHKKLSSAIERVLNDDEMIIRMKKASKLTKENSNNDLSKFINELHLYLKKQNY